MSDEDKQKRTDYMEYRNIKQLMPYKKTMS